MYTWFKCHHDQLEDPNILDLSDTAHRVWINITRLASKSQDRGTIKSPISGIAKALRIPKKKLEKILDRLEELGLIRRENDQEIIISDWELRQGKPDNSAERQRRHRKRITEMSRDSHTIEENRSEKEDIETEDIEETEDTEEIEETEEKDLPPQETGTSTSHSSLQSGNNPSSESVPHQHPSDNHPNLESSIKDNTSIEDSIKKALDCYNSVFKKHWKKPFELTPGRKKRIKDRLKKFSLEDIFEAIKVVEKIPFYVGVNGDHQVIASPDYLFKDDETIEKFINQKEKNYHETTESERTSKDGYKGGKHRIVFDNKRTESDANS